MKKRCLIVSMLAVVGVVLATLLIVYRNRIIHFKEFDRCSDLIEYTEDIIPNGFTLYDIEETEDGILITYKYNDSVRTEGVSAITQYSNTIRNRINDYLEMNEDFYYFDSKIEVRFVFAGKGSSDPAENSVHFMNYSNETIYDSLCVIKPIKDSKISEISMTENIHEISEFYIQVDDFTFFENNPQLKYCKLRCDNPEEAEKKIKSLCPDCVVEWM